MQIQEIRTHFDNISLLIGFVEKKVKIKIYLLKDFIKIKVPIIRRQT